MEEDVKEHGAEALSLEQGKSELLHRFTLLLLFIHLILLNLGLLQEIHFNDSGDTTTSTTTVRRSPPSTLTVWRGTSNSGTRADNEVV